LLRFLATREAAGDPERRRTAGYVMSIAPEEQHHAVAGSV